MSGKILIIDDEPTICDLMCQYLEMLQYESKMEITGNAGLQAIQEWQPDFLILDVMLPDKDGYEICREIRKNESTKQLPVLMLTALSGQKNRQDGFSAGADVIMNKPFLPDELVQELQLLNSHHFPGKKVRYSNQFSLNGDNSNSSFFEDFQARLGRICPLSNKAIEQVVHSLKTIVIKIENEKEGDLQCQLKVQIDSTDISFSIVSSNDKQSLSNLQQQLFMDQIHILEKNISHTNNWSHLNDEKEMKLSFQLSN